MRNYYHKFHDYKGNETTTTIKGFTRKVFRKLPMGWYENNKGKPCITYQKVLVEYITTKEGIVWVQMDKSKDRRELE